MKKTLFLTAILSAVFAVPSMASYTNAGATLGTYSGTTKYYSDSYYLNANTTSTITSASSAIGITPEDGCNVATIDKLTLTTADAEVAISTNSWNQYTRTFTNLTIDEIDATGAALSVAKYNNVNQTVTVSKVTGSLGSVLNSGTLTIGTAAAEGVTATTTAIGGMITNSGTLTLNGNINFVTTDLSGYTIASEVDNTQALTEGNGYGTGTLTRTYKVLNNTGTLTTTDATVTIDGGAAVTLSNDTTFTKDLGSTTYYINDATAAYDTTGAEKIVVNAAVTLTTAPTTGQTVVLNDSASVLDLSSIAFNRDTQISEFASVSGNGTMKLANADDAELIQTSTASPVTVDVNVEYTGTGTVMLVGAVDNNKMIINEGKTLSLNSAILWDKRTNLVVNGTLNATALKIGHEAAGDYPGVTDLSSTGTVKVGYIQFCNQSTSNAFNMAGGTLEFTQDTDSAISKTDSGNGQVVISGGTLKASDSSWHVDAGTVPVSLGNVTVETGTDKSITFSNDLTLTGTITNKGTFTLGGALSATALSSFEANGTITYSDGKNGFLNGSYYIVKNSGDTAATTITNKTLTIGGTSYTIDQTGSGSAMITIAGTSGAYYVNEAASTSGMTLGADDTIVATGAALTVDTKLTNSVSTTAATDITITSTGSLNKITSGTATLHGEGTYAITSVSASSTTPLGTNVSLGSDWTGLVTVTSSSAIGKIAFDSFVNGDKSKVQFTQTEGWIAPNSTAAADMVLANDAKADTQFALKINGMNTGAIYGFSGQITGDGTFLLDQKYDATYGYDRSATFNFSGDISGWDGSLNVAQVGTGTATINLTGSSTIGVSVDNTSSASNIALNITNASNDVVMNGSLSKGDGTGNTNVTLNTKSTTFNKAVDVSTMTVTAGNVTLNEDTAIGTLTAGSNTVTLAADKTLTVGTAATIGTLSAADSKVTVEDDATLTVSTDTTIDTLTLNGGTIELGTSHDKTLTVDTKLVLGETSTINANLVLSSGANVTLADGASVTMGCTVQLSDDNSFTITKLVSDDFSSYVTIMTSVEDVLDASGTSITEGTAWTKSPTTEAWYTSVGVKDNLDGTYTYTLGQSTDNLMLAYNKTDGTLMLTPEPATATLSLLALAGLCARRRRRA